MRVWCLCKGLTPLRQVIRGSGSLGRSRFVPGRRGCSYDPPATGPLKARDRQKSRSSSSGGRKRLHTAVDIYRPSGTRIRPGESRLCFMPGPSRVDVRSPRGLGILVTYESKVRANSDPKGGLKKWPLPGNPESRSGSILPTWVLLTLSWGTPVESPRLAIWRNRLPGSGGIVRSCPPNAVRKRTRALIAGRMTIPKPNARRCYRPGGIGLGIVYLPVIVSRKTLSLNPGTDSHRDPGKRAAHKGPSFQAKPNRTALTLNWKR